ncbi:MAG: hypothetical protein OXG76_14490 [Acidimicrobiaceae bacterium]|nr:hypothetical protein [Acidimicrobiaceae bacterium]
MAKGPGHRRTLAASVSEGDWPAYWWWRDGPVPPGDCVIVDIDGVLADASHRQHHLDGPWRDWDSFFADVGDDDVLDEVFELLVLLNPELVVVALTSRPTWVSGATLDWLVKHKVRWDLLIMRPMGDFQPSPLFKGEQTQALLECGYTPRLAIDDDMRNVRMYRDLDLPTLYIDSGYHPH